MIAAMLRKTGTKLAIVFLTLTFIFWLTSMVTPGWFVLSSNTYKDHVLQTKLSIFYVTVCINDNCEYRDFSGVAGIQVHVPHQVESLLALVLCAISGILVIVPINRTATKFLIVVIIIPVAATLQSVLILLFAVVNTTITSITTVTDAVLFPYSILLSGLGTLLSIVAWVICVVVYNNERKRESQNQRHRMDQTDPLPVADLELPL